MALSIQIVINITGESAGAPGVARTFAYSKLATSPTVTLSLETYVGVTSVYWEFVDIPSGSSAVLSSQTAYYPTFTPDVDGTYLVQCTANDGEAFDRNAIAFTTENLGLRKPAAGETNEFNQISGWKVAIEDLFDALDNAPLSGMMLNFQGGPFDYTQTDPPNEEVVYEFMFDGSDLPIGGTVTLRAMVTPNLSAAGWTRVRFYDLGPTSGAASPVEVTANSPSDYALETDSSGLQYLETEPFSVEAAGTGVPGEGKLVSGPRMYRVTIEQQSAEGDTAYLGMAALHVEV